MRDTIKLYGSKKLQTPTTAVESIGSRHAILFRKMERICRNNQGLGLAANQIGKSESIFVFQHLGEFKVAINPEITEVDGLSTEVEGCLSFPGVFYPIERPKTCLLKAWDEKGNDYELEADFLTARVILHESDHLLGKTMKDLLTEDQLKDFKTQWARKRQEYFSRQR